jgi:hypothetical protein
VPNQNLTQFGGSASGSVLDVAVQEYDLTNGELLFNWDALNHGGTPNIPLTQSQQKPYGGTPWDAYHLNSIQLIGSNEFLVSMRNTSSVYLVQVNGGTGKIKWTLSGDPQLSTFTLPKDAEFSWQHDVELLPNDEVSLFDDRCCAVLRPGMFARPSGPARGLILKLNMGKHTAALVGQYPRADNFDVFFLGSTQLLSNGNVLVGWGSQPYFTQFSKKGKVLLDVRWPGPDVSYRVLRHGWVGLPEYPPSGAVRKSNGKTTVYASWNGATRLAAWRVLSGFSKTHLSLTVKRTATKNFETPIAITGTRTWFEVQALGSNGRVIGSSSPFTFASQPVRRLRALAATRSS